MLHKLALRVLEAGNGESALRLVDADPLISHVILDLGLPGMRGEELAAAIRTRRPTLPIIVASGKMPEAPRQAGAPMALLFYLQKPYDQSGLQTTLRRAAMAAGS